MKFKICFWKSRENDLNLGSRLQVVSRRPPPTKQQPEPTPSAPASPPFTAFSAVPNARQRPAVSSSFGFQDEDVNEADDIQVPPSNFGSRGSPPR